MMVKSHLHDGTYLEKEGCTEWRFAYEPGVLKAVCGEAECSIQTAGKAVELSANVWHAEETINKEEVMQIEVSLPMKIVFLRQKIWKSRQR